MINVASACLPTYRSGSSDLTVLCSPKVNVPGEMHELDARELDEVSGGGLVGAAVGAVVGAAVGAYGGYKMVQDGWWGERLGYTVVGGFMGAVGGGLIGGIATGPV